MIERTCECGIPIRIQHECVTNQYPIPPEAEKPKRKGGDRHRTETAWPHFMKTWAVGQSVVLNFTALQSLQTYARRAGYKTHHHALPYIIGGLRAVRVWRTK